MSRRRLVIAVGLGAALLGLLAWQLNRERQISLCLEAGRTWTGTGCGRLDPRPILQRDLHRS
jgi:hypothetical protein